MTPRFDEVSPLGRVLLRPPRAAFGSQQRVSAQWRDLAWHGAPEFAAAVREFDAFAAILEDAGADVVLLGEDDSLTIDGLYVRDAAIAAPGGLIRAAMGKPQRAREPVINTAQAKAHGIATVGEISGPGRVEGGDLVWLDDTTLIAGHTYRTNPEGIAQLQALLGDRVSVTGFHMPHYKGPGDVFHLMSVLSPIDTDLALVYRPLMPVALIEFLEQRGIAFVDVPDEEFESMGCNVLAARPRQCVMVQGNPETLRRLEKAGAQVHVIAADNICRKGEGGPTCLTRPVERAA